MALTLFVSCVAVGVWALWTTSPRGRYPACASFVIVEDGFCDSDLTQLRTGIVNTPLYNIPAAATRFRALPYARSLIASEGHALAKELWPSQKAADLSACG